MTAGGIKFSPAGKFQFLKDCVLQTCVALSRFAGRDCQEQWRLKIHSNPQKPCFFNILLERYNPIQ